jgi:Ca2+-binding RTX toxin-like protein
MVHWRERPLRKGMDKEMKRLSLLLATMGMALLMSAGVAFADTFDCTVGRACTGTNGPDTLKGSAGSDYMDARQDDDELFGNEKHDSMSGAAFDAPDNDTSTDGNDLLKGGPGFDELVGYGGADELSGGDNGDFIFAEESSAKMGEDIVSGGRGNDYILARDGVKDTINCGKGNTDVVYFDKGGVDTVANNCEYKNQFPEEQLSRAASSATEKKVNAEKVNALRAR